MSIAVKLKRQPKTSITAAIILKTLEVLSTSFSRAV